MCKTCVKVKSCLLVLVKKNRCIIFKLSFPGPRKNFYGLYCCQRVLLIFRDEKNKIKVSPDRGASKPVLVIAFLLTSFRARQ